MDDHPSASGLSFEAVTADLRRDNQDLSSYAGYLLRSLYDALPAELVAADFARSLADKLRGRPGRLVRVTVTLGERRFVLVRTQLGARPEARIGHVSGGITLSTRLIPLDEWTAELGTALAGVSDLDTRAAAALHRLVIGGQIER
jgi:hypothetical protein